MDTKQQETMKPDFINYIQSTPRSLYDMAIVPVVSSLLHQPDIKAELMQMQNKLKRDCRLNNTDSLNTERIYKFCRVSVEKKIQANLQAFPIPKWIKTDILDLVTPMGIELLKYLDEDKMEYKLYNHSARDGCISWTTERTIDKIKTLERLLLDDSREKDFDVLFEIACSCFCEKYIFEMYEVLPPEAKERFNLERSHFTYYWMCVMENKLSDFTRYIFEDSVNNIYDREHNIYLNMFTLSILDANFHGVKYLWHHKLTEEEKRIHVNRWLVLALELDDEVLTYIDPGPNERTDIITFLLSHLSDKEQQAEIFHRFQDVILKSLSNHWSWQHYFLPTINKMWDFLDMELYCEIMTYIVEELQYESATKDLINLWWHSPTKFRKRFIVYCWQCKSDFRNLYQIDKSDFVFRVLYETIDAGSDSGGEKVDFDYVITILSLTYGTYEWVDKCLRKYFDSAKKINEFKKEFATKYFFEYVDEMKYEKNGLSLFENFLNYFLCNEDDIENLSGDCNKLTAEHFTRLTPTDNIREFKKEMMLSLDGIDLFFNSIFDLYRDTVELRSVDWKNSIYLIKLFSPWSRDMVAELSSKLDDSVRQNFFHYKTVLSKCRRALFRTLGHLVSYNGGDSYDDHYTLFLLKKYFQDNADNKKRKKWLRWNSSSGACGSNERPPGLKLLERRKAGITKNLSKNAQHCRKKNKKFKKRSTGSDSGSNNSGYVQEQQSSEDCKNNPSSLHSDQNFKVSTESDSDNDSDCIQESVINKDLGCSVDNNSSLYGAQNLKVLTDSDNDNASPCFSCFCIQESRKNKELACGKGTQDGLYGAQSLIVKADTDNGINTDLDYPECSQENEYNEE